MSELSKYLVEQVLLEDDSSIKNIVVVYVGRFQPMHKGHYAVYEHLTKKFGKDSVFIGSSDKVEQPKSPFNFKEKKQIMTTMFPIPKNKVVQIKSPYKPTEILSKFDEDTTAFITVVSEKDKNRLAGGKYYRPWKGEATEGYRDRGYVYVVPVLGKGVSGTEARNGLSVGSDEDKKEFFSKRVYPKFNQKIYDLVTSKLSNSLTITKETIEEWLLGSNILKEATVNVNQVGSADDGPTFMYPNYDIFNKISAKRAKKIGYEVVNMIMTKELEDYYEHPTYPTGPTQAVSYYPAGVLGKMTPNNQFDIYSNKAYDKWYQHMTRKATLAGYEIVFTQLERDAAKKLRKMAGKDAKGDKEFKNKVGNALDEAITLPVEIGDTLLMGKFKNKKVVVKKIGKDEHGMPTINGKKVVTFRYHKKRPNIFDGIVELAGMSHNCPKCGHQWELEVEDNENYTCHNCGWDTQSKQYRMDSPYIQKNGLLGKEYDIKNIYENVLTHFKNLGIPRTKMPQIHEKDLPKFRKYLDSLNIKHKNEKIPLEDLKFTQKELSLDKTKKFKGAKFNDNKLIITSKDNYILDGHHRVLAKYMYKLGDTINAIKVNLPIKKLLEVCHNFSEVDYKNTVHEVLSINEANDKLKLKIPNDIKKIHKAFKKNGKKLYVVGGAVRDAILGKSPKDFDLATDAKPEETVEIAKSIGFKNPPEVGQNFGVVIVGGHEIATFRKDIGKGRRPDSVDYTDIEGDVKRRDLTVNALFYDMDRGEIVDLVGGIEDLKNKKIRTVGNASERFEEDALRKLRALRFQARLGGTMDRDLLIALKQDPSLKDVSSERIRDEFIKSIKSAKSAKKYMEMVDKIGFTKLILPNLKVSTPYLDDNDYIMFLSYLLRDNDVSSLGKKLNKLNYTADEIKNIVFLISLIRFSDENIVSYKKSQARTSLSDEQILKFGKLIGKDMKKFIKFNLSVSGNDAPKELKGKEIGDWINNQEKKIYMGESIKESYIPASTKGDDISVSDFSTELKKFKKRVLNREKDDNLTFDMAKLLYNNIIKYGAQKGFIQDTTRQSLYKHNNDSFKPYSTSNFTNIAKGIEIILNNLSSSDRKSDYIVEGTEKNVDTNDKIKFYESYFKNLTPSGYEVKNLGDKLVIERKELKEDDEWKNMDDRKLHMALFSKALKQIPNSPRQKKVIKQMNILRKKNGLKPLNELAEMSMGDLKDVEDYADKKMAPVDVEFSRHFFDRLNDPRNGKEITPEELMDFFDRLSKRRDKFNEFIRKYRDFVVKDRKTAINIPLTKKTNAVLAKTVMRKRNWRDSDPIMATETKNDDSIDKLVEDIYESLDDIVLPKKKAIGKPATGGCPIPAEHVIPMYNEVVEHAIKMFGIKKSDMKPLGSTGKKPKGQTCGDIDIAIDGLAIGAKNKLKFDEVQDFIYNKVKSKYKNVKPMKGLGIVSFLYPIPNSNESGQVDFMITDNLELATFMFHSPNFINNESKYKGMYRNELLFSIVANMDTGDVNTYFEDGDVESFTKYTLTSKKGLHKQLKTFKGKRGKTKTAKPVDAAEQRITNVPLEIVKFIFGDKYTIADMNSFETIYKIVTSPSFKHKNKLGKIMEQFKKGVIGKGYPLPSELK